MRADTAKAAVWGGLAGSAQIVLALSPSALLPPFYDLVVAIGYGFLLPVIAVLHVRHRRVRESGAILGTIAGTTVVALGLVASVDPALATAALFVRAIWWWTIGKLWWETRALPATLGMVTMILAAFALLGSLIPSFAAESLDLALGLWLLGVSVALWRSR